ncbi:polysaccharide deacetylase [Gottschalkia acidurici 9a]|uniref:Polysaccharide deacetylase n=1 Tax=Gottschalkia acidurici (strain ATCC 7906 / DSM 604 / BCRC 14475 / CIP 104303 / KCTC 5404 / NCIMB 10678 / 9a) TaxID=1128398 RepID=K0AWJ5_GOTA9|nr:polysaccharide deacetylase family protein [Gottschalkia acidurici]AFS77609.1 polysaccharide deacetylase [Gottschalkia acidurici 9a]
MLKKKVDAYSKKDTKSVEKKKIPVLMYHHISNEVNSTLAVTPEKYLEDMITLKEAGYEAIFLKDLALYLKGSKELPEKPIVITFDDGYYSNYEHAFPVAKKTGMKFTVSIIGWSVGRSTFIDNSNPITPHFTWDQAKIMYDSGLVDIQNHTFDLHSRPGLSYGYSNSCEVGVLPLQNEGFSEYELRLKEDLTKLNMEINSKLGYTPTFLVYPYGAYNKDTEHIVAKLGFQGTVTIANGVREFKDLKDLREIPRLNVTNDLRESELIYAIENLPLK